MDQYGTVKQQHSQAKAEVLELDGLDEFDITSQPNFPKAIMTESFNSQSGMSYFQMFGVQSQLI